SPCWCPSASSAEFSHAGTAESLSGATPPPSHPHCLPPRPPGTPPHRFHVDCDMDASVLNPNSNSYATVDEESEITGELVLVFNKLGRTITAIPALQVAGRERSNYRQKKRRTGEGHEQEDTPRVRRPSRGAHSGCRPRRRRSQPGPGPVRPVSPRAPLHARTRPQVARQVRPRAGPARRHPGAGAGAREALIPRSR